MRMLAIMVLILAVMWGATVKAMQSKENNEKSHSALIKIELNPAAKEVGPGVTRYVTMASGIDREWSLYADPEQKFSIGQVPGGTRLPLVAMVPLTTEEPMYYILKVRFQNGYAWVHPNNTTGRVRLASSATGEATAELPIFIRQR